jgi:hypothetical protein
MKVERGKDGSTKTKDPGCVSKGNMGVRRSADRSFVQFDLVSSSIFAVSTFRQIDYPDLPNPKTLKGDPIPSLAD